MHIMGIKSREGVKRLSIERCTRYLWGHPHVLLPLEAKTGWTGDDRVRLTLRMSFFLVHVDEKYAMGY